MDTTEQAELLLDQLNQKYQLSLSFDDNGICNLRHGDGPELTLEIDTAQACLHGYASLPLYPSSDQERLDLYRTLLGWNLLGERTDGGSFALDPSDDTLLLGYRYPLDGFDLLGLETALNRLIDHSRDCLQELGKQPDTASPADEQPSSALDPMRFLNQRV